MNSKTWAKILTVVALAAVIVGCGGPRASVPAGAPGTPPMADVPRGNGDGSVDNPPTADRYNWPTGATVDLTIESYATLESYLGRPANLPVDALVIAKMNVDLRNLDTSSAQAFGGNIKIAFEESLAAGGTKYNEQKFATGSTLSALKYNKFHTAQGKPHFKSFSQDRFGGLILIIDEVDDLGLMSGSVYFKNFEPATIQQSPLEYCWNIKAGPYDCRDFLVSNNVDMTSAVFPTRLKNGTKYYTKLGTFRLMNGQMALNQ